MSDSLVKHRDEILRNSAIARLLLDGKLQEPNDVRLPPMDLSLKKSSDNDNKGPSSFGVRELMNGSIHPGSSKDDTKMADSLTFQPLNSEVTSDEKISSLYEKDFCKRDFQTDSLKNSIMPDSLTDSVPKMSPFVVMDRSRSLRCSEALRSLLLKPSSLLNKNYNLHGNRPPIENGILENSEIQGKCDFTELAKYLYRGDKLILSRACNATPRPRNCCLKNEEMISVETKKEDNSLIDSDVKQSLAKNCQEVLIDNSSENAETPAVKKQWKTKRKIKSESPEFSSGSNSTPEPHVTPDQKERISPSLKLQYACLPVSLDVKQGRFEVCKEEVKDHEIKNECDYDTFRKFKRFRKCLPASRSNPVAENPGGCQCNLKSLIQEIKSTKMSSLVDVGTQCLKYFSDASTQYDIPTTPVATCVQHLRRVESESENGVTEGVSMANEIHLKCLHCGITFEDDVIHSIHMGCHCHRDPFICNLCGRQCDNKYVFNTHILRGHQPV